MISTRFDNPEYWGPAQDKCTPIEKLETGHMLNIISMFERKPTLIQTSLINDITSMSIQELKDYWHGSALHQAMRNELLNRGVNVDQIMINFKEEK